MGKRKKEKKGKRGKREVMNGRLKCDESKVRKEMEKEKERRR